MSDFIPFLSWIRTYNQRHVKADLLAGLTVAVVAVPQCMAYALIAGLPVQYGLYAAIVPAIIGSLWGSSAQLITGPTTAISLVVCGTRLFPRLDGGSHSDCYGSGPIGLPVEFCFPFSNPRIYLSNRFPTCSA
jgi:hypothetical protein